MGSGGMVVMDERTCMVDVARYFLNFTKRNLAVSACLPGRHQTDAGNSRRHLRRQREQHDIDLLIELGHSVHGGSVCGLGQSAANPVLTTLRYFRDEYEAHINDKCCPARSVRN